MRAPRIIVGTDLAKVGDIAAAFERHGERYVTRLFTPDEIAYCREAPQLEAERFAARFAAKEAVIKVLRPDGTWPDWRTIEVRRHPGGWCDIVLHGTAAERAQAAGIASLSVSMSHDGEYAIAVVTAELEETFGGTT